MFLKFICKNRKTKITFSYFIHFSFLIIFYKCHTLNSRHVTNVGSHYKMVSYKSNSQTIQDLNNSNKQFITSMKIQSSFLRFLSSKPKAYTYLKDDTTFSRPVYDSYNICIHDITITQRIKHILKLIHDITTVEGIKHILKFILLGSTYTISNNLFFKYYL